MTQELTSLSPPFVLVSDVRCRALGVPRRHFRSRGSEGRAKELRAGACWSERSCFGFDRPEDLQELFLNKALVILNYGLEGCDCALHMDSVAPKTPLKATNVAATITSSSRATWCKATLNLHGETVPPKLRLS